MQKFDPSSMEEGTFILGIMFTFTLFVGTSPVFADSTHTSDQTTISEDLESNPVAQDIIKKIEEGKKWIAHLEQRDFEFQEKQKELEQKRAETLQILEDKMERWGKSVGILHI